jgi:dTDP-4-dehydrorhamnose reductase
MKIAVIGADGQLGTDVVRAFADNGDAVSPLTHSDLELSSIDSVSSRLQELRPDLVVNTAAMHHVDNCEREPDKAFAVNGIGARNLAAASRDIGAVLMHVSTDYVFDGNKASPYEEDDAPRPLNVYGNTKLAGEYFVRSGTEKHFVLRTSAIYGKSPCRAKGGLNFIELMLKLARERGEVRVVDSEFVSPTPTSELARQMVALSRSDAYGLYHATAEGSCSWHQFAGEIFALTDTKVSLKIAGPNEFPAKVPRPKYSVLENRALKSRGLNVFTSWHDGLREYLGARVEPGNQVLPASR